MSNTLYSSTIVSLVYVFTWHTYLLLPERSSTVLHMYSSEITSEVAFEKVLWCAWIKILLMYSVHSKHGLMSWAASYDTSLVVANVNKSLASSH